MKARVTYSLGRTVSTGRFENFKIGVEVAVECETYEIEETYQKAKAFVGERVEKEAAELSAKLTNPLECEPPDDWGG